MNKYSNTNTTASFSWNLNLKMDFFLPRCWLFANTQNGLSCRTNVNREKFQPKTKTNIFFCIKKKKNKLTGARPQSVMMHVKIRSSLQDFFKVGQLSKANLSMQGKTNKKTPQNVARLARDAFVLDTFLLRLRTKDN